MARVARIFSAVLLVVLGIVAVERSLLLARGASVAEIARAVGERRWLEWAFRDPALQASLRPVGEEIPRGDRVHLERPPDAPAAPWLTVMTRYFLPANRVTVEGYRAAEPGSRVVSLRDEAAPTGRSELVSQLGLLTGGTILMVLAGFWARGRRQRPFPFASPWEWGTALLRGLTLAVPVLVILRLSGVALSAGVVVAGTVIGVLAGRFLLSGPISPKIDNRRRAGHLLTTTAIVVTGILGLLVVWKVARMPLWSWDHFAIWGLKARQLVASGGALPEFLASELYRDWAGHYPLGAPVAWVALLLGGVPEAAGFKGAHLLLGAVLVLLVGAGARRLGCSSPLSWGGGAGGAGRAPPRGDHCPGGPGGGRAGGGGG
ncbi:MAG: hypothetical protein R3234_11085, partial [Thermoanaerobaculia bacterium]|nr:hypothetical protein [Thermoanaerobaculia bacterium]